MFTKSYINLYDSKPFSRHINIAICELAKYNKDILSYFQIGSSVQGTPILAVKLGCGSTKILVQGTHHAREAINTILLLDQINYMVNLYNNPAIVCGINIRELLNRVTFVFVPLVNPDGADLVLSGKEFIFKEYQSKDYLQKESFLSWKSNINGVDLNRNYPTSSPSTDLAKSPGSEGYPGPYCFSEPETYALKVLTECYNFNGTISYHSSGEEIYWYFNQIDENRDLIIAKSIALLTGYKLIPKEESTTGNGYKDWFIENYQKPSLTIEVSPYVGPTIVLAENYYVIFQKNINVPIVFADLVDCMEECEN